VASDSFEDVVACNTDTDTDTDTGRGGSVDCAMGADTTGAEDPYLWDPPPSGMSYGTWWNNNEDKVNDR